MLPTHSITLLGLGPGDPNLLTRQAWDVLQSVSEVYLRTSQHPSVECFPKTLTVNSFDHLYETGESFEAVYAQIIDQVLQLGLRPQGVIYAVPGHPLVAEATCPEILRRAREENLSVQVVEGLSFLEPVFTALEVDPFPITTMVDAFALSDAHHPPFPPDVPAVIAQIHSQTMASEVKLTLMAIYPDEHPVKLLHAAGTLDFRLESMPLYKIDHSPHIGMLTSLYVPPLGPETSIESFQEIIAHLRAPDGCPWDREQTHRTLRPFLLEETYETLAALDADDPEAMREEFGDLLLQIVLHAQIAGEQDKFTMADIIREISSKLIHRHPHVFAGLDVGGVDEVRHNWESLKLTERKKDSKQATSVLDGVSLASPALAQSSAYQKRATQMGFDWPELKGIFDKIAEELGEVHTASNDEARSREIGDLLFVIVQLANRFNIDAETALREANARFRKRFTTIENTAIGQRRAFSELSLDEMNSLWEIP